MPRPDAPVAAPYSTAHLRRDIGEDVETYLDFAAEYSPDRRTAFKRLSALLTPSVMACALYRLSHWLHGRGHRRLAGAVAAANLLATRAAISPASRIGGGLYIPHPATGVVFVGVAGRNLRLFAGASAGAPGCSPLHDPPLGAAPRFGDDVALGSKSYVAGPVTVGAGARIGFNVYVDRDIPAGARVVSARVRLRILAPPAQGAR